MLRLIVFFVGSIIYWRWFISIRHDLLIHSRPLKSVPNHLWRELVYDPFKFIITLTPKKGWKSLSSCDIKEQFEELRKFFSWSRRKKNKKSFEAISIKRGQKMPLKRDIFITNLYDTNVDVNFDVFEMDSTRISFHTN